MIFNFRFLTSKLPVRGVRSFREERGRLPKKMVLQVRIVFHNWPHVLGSLLCHQNWYNVVVWVEQMESLPIYWHHTPWYKNLNLFTWLSSTLASYKLMHALYIHTLLSHVFTISTLSHLQYTIFLGNSRNHLSSILLHFASFSWK